jgi:hypothetical protein
MGLSASAGRWLDGVATSALCHWRYREGPHCGAAIASGNCLRGTPYPSDYGQNPHESGRAPHSVVLFRCKLHSDPLFHLQGRLKSSRDCLRKVAAAGRDRKSWRHEPVAFRERFRAHHQADAQAGVPRGDARRRPVGRPRRPDRPACAARDDGATPVPGAGDSADPLPPAVVRPSRRGGRGCLARRPGLSRLRRHRPRRDRHRGRDHGAPVPPPARASRRGAGVPSHRYRGARGAGPPAAARDGGRRHDCGGSELDEEPEGHARPGDAPDPEGESVVLRNGGARRRGRGIRAGARGRLVPRERARPRRGRRATSRPRGTRARRRGVPGRGEPGHRAGGGLARGDPPGATPAAPGGVGRGGDGAGEGLGAREGGAPVPGGEALIRAREGPVPGPRQERGAPRDLVRALERVDGTARAPGGVSRGMPGRAPQVPGGLSGRGTDRADGRSGHCSTLRGTEKGPTRPERPL